MQRCVVAIPTLNEQTHLLAVIEGFLADPAVAAIWVMEGGSKDATTWLARGATLDMPRVKVIPNRNRTQAHACNLAAAQAEALGFDVMIRADAHARYPDGFASTLLAAMAQTEAASVVVPLIAEASDKAPPWQQAAACLQRSWLGTGGATHRMAGTGGWVDHGHHAAFKVAAFRQVGGYDTAFRANEDVELDLRLAAAGYRIWQCAKAPVLYTPRATPGAIFTQMRRNGRGRAQTAQKHHRPLGLRQRLPLIATLGALISAVAALWHPVLGLPALAYAGLLMGLAVRAGPQPWRIATLAALANAGFALGLIERARL